MPRYVDSVLQPGEKVRHVTTVSWVTYIPGVLAWIVGLIVYSLTPAQAGFGRASILFSALVICGFGAVLIARAWFRRFTTEVAVTDRRIIYKRGFIWRHTVEMHMDKVESVDVDQSILGRLLNFGDIIIHGTGDTVEPLREIDHPIDFRNHVTAE